MIELPGDPDRAPDRLARRSASAVRSIHAYALVCLTSPNGAGCCSRRSPPRGLDARALANATVAAIGPGTAARARRPRHPRRHRSRALDRRGARGGAGASSTSRAVRRSSPAPPRPVTCSPRRCASVGPRWTSSPCTRPSPRSPTRRRSRRRWTPTTSPSPRRRRSGTSSRRWAGAPPAAARVVVDRAGHRAAAREAGLEVDVEAERHDLDGLVEALLARRGARTARLTAGGPRP